MKTTFVLLCLAAAAAAGTGYFWVITDMHLQTSYKVGGNPAKKCHGSGSTAGKYGDYVNCSAPLATAQALMNFIVDKSNEQGFAPDFVFWGGDILTTRDPDDNAANMKTHFSELTTLLEKVNKSFSGKTKIFPVHGNHDATPLFAFPTDSSHTTYTVPYNAFNKFLTSDAHASLKKGGYYSQVVRPGLRFIGLNTGLYYNKNSKPVNATANTDPLGQLAWLKTTLKNAKSAGEKVLIGTHIAPGMSVGGSGYSITKVWSDRLLKAMDGYHGNTIIASFYGHTHDDNLRVFRDTTGSKTEAHIGYIISSGTSRTKVNPSVTLFKYNTDAPFTLMDKYVYYFDLTKANKAKKITWKTLYQFTKLYNVTDINTANVLKVVDKLNDRNGAAWKSYWTVQWANYAHAAASASEHKKRMCAMKNTYSKDADACVKKA